MSDVSQPWHKLRTEIVYVISSQHSLRCSVDHGSIVSLDVHLAQCCFISGSIFQAVLAIDMLNSKSDGALTKAYQFADRSQPFMMSQNSTIVACAVIYILALLSIQIFVWSLKICASIMSCVHGSYTWHKGNVLSAPEYCRQLGNISLSCVVSLDVCPFAFRHFFTKWDLIFVILGGVGIVGAVLRLYCT